MIDNLVFAALNELPSVGLINIFIKHTSAGLTLNENCDPDVRTDFETISNKLIPDISFGLKHTMEGLDDMSAHFKSSIIGQNITIPITNGKPNLGTWQGIYLCEFRNNGGKRQLVLTVYS